VDVNANVKVIEWRDRTGRDGMGVASFMGACVVDYSNLPITIFCPLSPSNHLSCPSLSMSMSMSTHTCVQCWHSTAEQTTNERVGTDKLGVVFAVAVARRSSRGERERKRVCMGYGVEQGNR
jgi:hypothetical protein